MRKVQCVFVNYSSLGLHFAFTLNTHAFPCLPNPQIFSTWPRGAVFRTVLLFVRVRVSVVEGAAEPDVTYAQVNYQNKTKAKKNKKGS